MAVVFKTNDKGLDSGTFLALVQKVWPGEYDPERAARALRKTINITAWNGEHLIGCVRILSDGYFFGTIPEILVDPEFRKQGVGRRLMELAWDASPTGLFFGGQPGNERFFERLGYERGMQSYQRRKLRSQ